MRKYRLIISQNFEAVDDIAAREQALSILENLGDLTGLDVKLQKIFTDKPPTKVRLPERK